MNGSSPILMVAVEDAVVFVKISGRATCHCSVDFKSLFSEFLQRGFEDYVVDLSDCLIMDSTFLGVLARNGVRVMEEQAGDCPHRVRLLNPNERVDSLIDNLGVMKYFEVIRNGRAKPRKYETRPTSTNHSREELIGTCLEAHEELNRLNPKNRAKLKDVTTFLKEDMKKLKKRKK